MSRIMILAALLAAAAVPAAAQEADTTPAAEAEAPAPAPEAPEAAEHDWEFALAATDRAPGATANVMVTESDGGSDFILVANGLPVVDSLDQEGRDVNAYTVWIVADKEKVAESDFAGVLSVTPEGEGRFEGATPLETFGLIVTATPDGAPERIGGVPVLTGIPVRAETPAEEPAEGEVEEAAEEAADVAEDVAEEAADVAEDVAEETADVAENAADAAEDVVDGEDPDATP